jgi:Protein of unknown function (DUF1822)
MNIIQPKTVSIPLGQQAHDLACQFAAEQATPYKGKQIYLNTLAVYAVHQYLKWLQVETDLTQGDSWNSNVRSLFNTADLVIPDVGKLECRPVLPHEDAFAIPAEVLEDRIGYVGVQFGDTLDRVQLLGFMRAAVQTPECMRIVDLSPLESLLDALDSAPQPVSQTDSTRVNLTQWLQSIFETGWQSLDSLLTAEPDLSLAYGGSYRNSRAQEPDTAKGAKLLDLGVTLGNQAVVLLVAIAPDQTRGLNILVQLHPARGQYLPPQIKLLLLAETGTVLQEIQARSQDNYIQMRQFWGQVGETFRVQVSLNSVSAIEHFIL